MTPATVSAREIYDTALLGSLVRFSDGAPEPPARHRRKHAAWTSSNAAGRLVRRTPADHISPPSFMLHLGDRRVHRCDARRRPRLLQTHRRAARRAGAGRGRHGAHRQDRRPQVQDRAAPRPRGGAGREADPQLGEIARATGLELLRVRSGLNWLLAVAVEAVSCFGLFAIAWHRWPGRGGERPTGKDKPWRLVSREEASAPPPLLRLPASIGQAQPAANAEERDALNGKPSRPRRTRALSRPALPQALQLDQPAEGER